MEFFTANMGSTIILTDMETKIPDSHGECGTHGNTTAVKGSVWAI